MKGLRNRWLAILDELALELAKRPTENYSSRRCTVSVDNWCDAGGEAVVEHKLNAADLDYLRAAVFNMEPIK